MAEPKVEMYELNVFGDNPKSHLKLTGPGTPTLELVAAAFKRLDDACDLYNGTRETQQTPDGPHEASAPKPAPQSHLSSGPTIRDPEGEASGKQKGMIKGTCEGKDDKEVVAILGKFGDPDGAYTADGHYTPSWEYLNMLTKGDASKIIDALMKVGDAPKLPQQKTDMPFE